MQNDISPDNTAIEEVRPAEIKDGQLILTEKHKQLIKDQIAPNATPEELQLFFMMAHRTRLDPLLQQLYFIKYGQGERARVSYVTSIDGYRIIAHRTGQFAGIDEPRYQMNNSGQLESCTITVYRKDCDKGFSATVYLKEYNTGINLWAKMPMTMIAKVAEAHALRKAFPQDLSGVYTTDEMDQAQTQPSLTTKPTIKPKISVPQINYLNSLLSSKGKTLKPILEYYKIKDLKDLDKKYANEVIDRLSKMPDKVMEIDNRTDKENVDLDELPDDLENVVEPSATAGQIALFTAMAKKRATTIGKDYDQMINEMLSLYSVAKLEDLNRKQIKDLTDKIVNLNLKSEDNQLEKNVSDVFNEEVE